MRLACLGKLADVRELGEFPKRATPGLAKLVLADLIRLLELATLSTSTVPRVEAAADTSATRFHDRKRHIEERGAIHAFVHLYLIREAVAAAQAQTAAVIEGESVSNRLSSGTFELRRATSLN